jgi:hypothetical protein
MLALALFLSAYRHDSCRYNENWKLNTSVTGDAVDIDSNDALSEVKTWISE